MFNGCPLVWTVDSSPMWTVILGPNHHFLFSNLDTFQVDLWFLGRCMDVFVPFSCLFTSVCSIWAFEMFNWVEICSLCSQTCKMLPEVWTLLARALGVHIRGTLLYRSRKDLQTWESMNIRGQLLMIWGKEEISGGKIEGPWTAP